jgi:peptide/nickel transport system substrate-binding protein
MKKLYFSLAILLIAILALTSCGSATTTTVTATATETATATATATSTPTQTTTATPTPTETAKYGGTLRIIYQYSPASTPGWPGDTTNPQKLWTCWLTFEALVKLDNLGQPIPWLATDWEFAPDYSYIDFTLRQGVKFHDGTDFTAESVVAHVNQLFADGDSAVIDWDSIEKTGDYSVRLYIKSYERNFWNNLAGWSMFFTSDTQLKEQGLDYVKEHPIGTGPFKFASFEKDVSLKFVRNDNYWQEGKPYLDGINFYTTKEPLTQQAKMQSGEGDVLTLQSDGKVLDDMKMAGFDVITMTGSSNFIIFDTANQDSITNDPKVRMAIEYALNKQEIADTLGYGYMKPNNQIPFTGNPAYNPNLDSRDYDPEMAKQLLEDAGYPNGVTLHMISENSGSDFAVLFQQYMADAGITIELEMVDNAKLWNYLFSGWQGMIATGYAMGTNLPNFIRSYFPPRGTFDVSVKIPDDILAKCDEAMQETDDAKFQELSNEISQWIYDTAFFVPTVGVAMGYIISPDVKDSDLLVKYVDFTVWSPENTWLDR